MKKYYTEAEVNTIKKDIIKKCECASWIVLLIGILLGIYIEASIHDIPIPLEVSHLNLNILMGIIMFLCVVYAWVIP